MQLKGRAGLNGWRWIFIIEGALTCVLAIASYWLLVDFPDSHRKSWRFLGTRERQWVVDRIQRDRGDTQLSPFRLRTFLSAGRDWKIWAYAFIFFNTTTITYALAYTLPILLVGNLGFDVGAAQCLVAPPYAFAGIVMFTSGYLGDRYRIRGPIILFNMVLCLIGLPIMGWHPNAAVRYFGVFLVTAGANSNVPAILSFQANNLRGQWKRAFASSIVVGFGGIGGIAGSLVFREQDKATGYRPGMYACIACSLLNMVLVLLCDLDFYRQNRLADQGKTMLESAEVGRSNTLGPLRLELALFLVIPWADVNQHRTTALKTFATLIEEDLAAVHQGFDQVGSTGESCTYVRKNKSRRDPPSLHEHSASYRPASGLCDFATRQHHQ